MIYKIFKDALLQNPNGRAIITSKGLELSYLEVEDIANKLANYLLSSGIKPNQIVAVLTENEDLHVFLFLALNLIGATYLPFDLDTLLARIKYGLESLSCAKILLDENFLDDFSSEISLSINSQTLATIQSSNPQPVEIIQPTISYIISSSGSTGTPKWIPIQGDGLIYWAEIEREQLDLNVNDKILCTRSPAYDARISEYVRAFAGCGSLYLMNSTERKDMESILEFCQKFQITCLILIASQLNQENTAYFLKELKLRGLKHLMVTGDACSPLLVKQCEEYDINLWNCYGPTEATFGMSILKVNGLLSEDKNRSVVPIASPKYPVKSHIIKGKLYIESPFLSEGYLGASNELNEKSFPIINIGGQAIRVFDSGDQFSELSIQFLSFEGRAGDDCHAKVNGVKIFPFLIEQTIQTYSLTAFKAVVVIKKWMDQDKPFAYLELNHEIDKVDFLQYLKSNLKKEEIPIFIALPELPILQQSQKIDRKLLTQRLDSLNENFFIENDNLGEEFDDERAHYHRVLTEIWCEIFNLGSVSIKQDFIFSGGDSFLANKFAQKIKEKLKDNFRYSELLKIKTITIFDLTEYLLTRDLDSPLENTALINSLCTQEFYTANLYMLPPILGEGYFTYRYLAIQIAEQLKRNVYGLSDPSIFDEKFLPKSLDEAAQRYLEAIKKIQPKGPYELLGYSFGTTLAWKVAKKLEEQGEILSKLYLLDGFPPLLYQQLDNAGHAYLLESLISLIVDTLNNDYYAQSLIARQYNCLDRYNPLQQIEETLNHILSELNQDKPHFDEAKRLVLIAKRHLTLIHCEALAETRSNCSPSLYITNKTQPFLVAIESIQSLSKLSADHSYFYWNNYFKTMRKNAANIQAKHHEILAKNRSFEVNQYFTFSHDLLFNFHHDPYHFTPKYFWDNDELQLFFLKANQGQTFHKIRNFTIHKTIYTNYRRQNDSLYFQLEYSIVKVPKEKREGIEKLLKTSNISEWKKQDLALKPNVSKGSKPIKVHLNVMLGTHYLYSLDFIIFINEWPTIEAGDCCLKVWKKDVLHYVFLIDDLDKESLNKAQDWIINAIDSLRSCFDFKKGQSLLVKNQNCFFSPKNSCESNFQSENVSYQVKEACNLALKSTNFKELIGNFAKALNGLNNGKKQKYEINLFFEKLSKVSSNIHALFSEIPSWEVFYRRYNFIENNVFEQFISLIHQLNTSKKSHIIIYIDSLNVKINPYLYSNNSQLIHQSMINKPI
ncbi:MAG: AMP-binding protein [Tatlockia sp.]|nr:AMP-binding protein [Tatlockia sp.]